MAHVLVVDDDVELVELLRQFLEREGFTVEAAYDGQAGVERALTGDVAIVILDVMLPLVSGFDVLRRIRERSPVPVIMLTARGEEVDRVVGLEIGADDYLPKPFSPRELVARMRAVLRRVESAPAAPEVLVLGDLRLDLGAREVRLAGEPVPLTGVEIAVLEALLRSAGRVVTRDELSRAALLRPASALDRSLDMHLSNLRRKLGPLPGGGERIKTIRSVGYQYVRPADAG